MTWDHKPARRTVLGLMAAGGVLAATRPAFAGSAIATPGLPERVQEIIGRPVFNGSRWGMAFARPDTGEIVHSVNQAELFTAASSFKVFIGGTAFDALGPDHRFRTRVVRTGPVSRGVLHGDLVLVAGGDMLLAGRTQPDGTLNLRDPDHSYPGAPPLPGDRLAEIRDLAGQVRAAGIRRVTGRVVVDISLFREGREGIAFNNQMITVSPIMINDHIVHAVVTPGSTAGAPAVVQANPLTSHVQFVNEVTTVAGAAQPLKFVDARLTGEISLGSQPLYAAYYVQDPSTFAATVLTEVLQDKGIRIEAGSPRSTCHVQVAELVSPPLAEQAKVMLKVSSNIHTVTLPYLVGAIAGRNSANPKASYEDYRRALFRAAGIDPDPAGAAEGTYTADSFIRFLGHMTRQPYFARFRDTLPIMGRDGSLAGNQPDSPAAGHVYAKTGTGVMQSPTGAQLHKALAGFIELPQGDRLTFAQFMRLDLASPAAGQPLAAQAQEAMAEITTAVYETFARITR
jgi:PBP4 family serine-type D-alanyl-D-alanine carboxypeptidase